MSTPSHPQSPAVPDDPAQPSTREIPVIAPEAAAPEPAVPSSPPPASPLSVSPLPPHPGATAHAPVAPQPTGPVDFVPGPPGPPGPGTPVPPAGPATGATAVSATPTWPDTLESEDAAGERRRLSAPRLPRASAGAGVAVLGLVLLELGLLPAFGARPLWSVIPLWAAFATLAALAALLAFVPGATGGSAGADRSGLFRRTGMAGAAGVAAFWLLVVVPDAASNRGFVLTAAAVCLGIGVWLGSRRSH